MSNADQPYINLAWALVESAASDYHNFHNPDLRRKLVMSVEKDERRSKHSRLRWAAEMADYWLSGSNAKYPFWLAAQWLGWDEKVLADRIRDGRTGENLLLQAATTEKNKHLTAEERLGLYLRAA